jgi:signal peptidase I
VAELVSTNPPDSGSPATGDPHSAQEPARRGRWRSGVEWVVIIAAALIVALLIKTFLIEAFYIPSASMQPTLVPGDRVLVNKLSYDLHGIHRGDVVVFKRPPLETDLTIKDLIKRVIGLPGECIWAADGQVTINGKVLKEPYLPADDPTNFAGVTPREPDYDSARNCVLIPKGEYYVLGDNRGNSRDSRYIGPIPANLIVGRAFVVVWPISALKFL